MAADEQEIVFPVAEVRDAPLFVLKVANRNFNIDRIVSLPKESNGKLGLKVVPFPSFNGGQNLAGISNRIEAEAEKGVMDFDSAGFKMNPEIGDRMSEAANPRGLLAKERFSEDECLWVFGRKVEESLNLLRGVLSIGIDDQGVCKVGLKGFLHADKNGGSFSRIGWLPDDGEQRGVE